MPGWLTDRFLNSFWLSCTLALNPERQALNPVLSARVPESQKLKMVS